MKLPEWTEAGLLPPGVHRTELPDIYERFVVDAPHRARRELLFEALTLHVKLVQAIVPAGLAWIDGSFCRCWHEPPDDVDIVFKPADWGAFVAMPDDLKTQMYGLLTLQDVAATEPAVYLDRLQPVGGAVDAFICRPGVEDYWHSRWSRVLDTGRSVVVGTEKGYAEVAW